MQKTLKWSLSITHMWVVVTWAVYWKKTVINYKLFKSFCKVMTARDNPINRSKFKTIEIGNIVFFYYRQYLMKLSHIGHIYNMYIY